MTKLILYELLCCGKVEDAFGMIADTKDWDQSDFCRKWLKSDLIKALARHDNPITQSKLYYYNDIVDELEGDVKPSNVPMHKPAVEWFGYLTMYWMLSEQIDAEEISKYNIDMILQFYDVLHTYSIEHAIEDIRENY